MKIPPPRRAAQTRLDMNSLDHSAATAAASVASTPAGRTDKLKGILMWTDEAGARQGGTMPSPPNNAKPGRRYVYSDCGPVTVYILEN